MSITMLKKYGIRRSLIVMISSILLLGSKSVSTQDVNFSQFSMTPMHYNPAFAGNTYAPLIHLNSRVQWPGVGLAYNSVAASYDQYFKSFNSGVGFYLMNDSAGKGIYNTLRIEALYSYNLRFRKQGALKLGISIALAQNRLNWDKLIFYDQLDPDYGYLDEFGNPNSSEEIAPDRLTVIYPDLSVGLLYYSEKFYAGVSVKHGNSPDQGFIGGTGEHKNGLALRYSAHIGMQIPFGDKTPGASNFIHPSLLYTRQANIDQLTLNTHVNLGMIYAGIGYRHAIENPDAVLLSFGVDLGMYTIGYSYDHTVSALTVNTGGSHELGVKVNFDGTEWFEAPYRYSDCFEIFR